MIIINNYVCIYENIVKPSELKQYLSVYLSAGEIVGHGILLVGDIRHPIVRVDVAYAEKVQAVYAEPYILEYAFFFLSSLSYAL